VAAVTATAYATQAKIKRAVKAAKACGIDVGGYDVRPDGTIRVFDIRTMPAPPPTDEFARLEREGKL